MVFLISRWDSVLAVVLATALAGACSDEKETSASPPSPSGPVQIAPHKVHWLELNAPITPEQWLASRNEEHLRAGNEQEVMRIGRLLDKAHQLYRESRRMIANRAVQVEAMLSADSSNESAVSVLEDLASIAGEVGQTEGFGAMSQHYVNMRSAGRSRQDALGMLRDLYGSRK